MGFKEDRENIYHNFNIESPDDPRNVPDWLTHKKAFVGHIADYLATKPNYLNTEDRANFLKDAFVEYRKWRLTERSNISDKDLGPENYDYDAIVSDMMKMPMPDNDSNKVLSIFSDMRRRFENEYCPQAKEERERISELSDQRQLDKKANVSQEDRNKKLHDISYTVKNSDKTGVIFKQNPSGKRLLGIVDEYASSATNAVYSASKETLVNNLADALIARRSMARLDQRPDLSDEELFSDNLQDKEKIVNYTNTVYNSSFHAKAASMLQCPYEDEPVSFFDEIFEKSGVNFGLPQSVKPLERPWSPVEITTLRKNQEELDSDFNIAIESRFNSAEENTVNIPEASEKLDKIRAELKDSYSKILLSTDKDTVINEAAKSIINMKSLDRMGVDYSGNAPQDTMGYAFYRNEEDLAAVKKYLEETYADNWYSDLKEKFSYAPSMTQNAYEMIQHAGCKPRLTEEEYQDSLQEDEMARQKAEEDANKSPEELEAEETAEKELKTAKETLSKTQSEFEEKAKQAEKLGDKYIGEETRLYYTHLADMCELPDDGNYEEIYKKFVGAVRNKNNIVLQGKDPVTRKLNSYNSKVQNAVENIIGEPSADKCREFQKLLTSEEKLDKYINDVIDKIPGELSSIREKGSEKNLKSFKGKVKGLRNSKEKLEIKDRLKLSMYESLSKLVKENDPDKIMDLAADITGAALNTNTEIRTGWGIKAIKENNKLIRNYLETICPKDNPASLENIKNILLSENDRVYFVRGFSEEINNSVNMQQEELRKAKVAEERKTSQKAEKEEKPEVESEIKPEVKEEVRPEVKPEIKEEVQPEIKPEVKAEAQPEIKPEVKVEPQPEVKPEIKVEAQPEAGDNNRVSEAKSPEEERREFREIAGILKKSKTTVNSKQYKDLITLFETLGDEKYAGLSQNDRRNLLAKAGKTVNEYIAHKSKDGIKPNAFKKLAAVEIASRCLEGKLAPFKNDVCRISKDESIAVNDLNLSLNSKLAKASANDREFYQQSLSEVKTGSMIKNIANAKLKALCEFVSVFMNKVLLDTVQTNKAAVPTVNKIRKDFANQEYVKQNCINSEEKKIEKTTGLNL